MYFTSVKVIGEMIGVFCNDYPPMMDYEVAQADLDNQRPAKSEDCAPNDR